MTSSCALGIILVLMCASMEVSGFFKRGQKIRRSPDNSAIFFPSSNSGRYQTARLTGSKRSLPDSDSVFTRYSDLYPQTNFLNAERPVRSDPSLHGPQNGFGGNGGWQQNPWGNSNNNFNGPQGGNQPNWGHGGHHNQPWGNGGGNFNNPGDDDNGEAFVFDRPPSPGPGNGGNRPPPGRPGNGGNRPPPGRPGNGGVVRPPPGRPGNGAGAFPPPGRPNNGGGGRPSSRPPTATPAPNRPPTVATTTPAAPGRPTTPGLPVTSPTPAPTRPGCNCPSTPEFNPVCGQDRVTYSNPGKLRCANICGNNVSLSHYGACIRTTTQPPASGR